VHQPKILNNKRERERDRETERACVRVHEHTRAKKERFELAERVPTWYKGVICRYTILKDTDIFFT